MHALEKEMATHSSILAWRDSQGQRSLVSCCLWGHTELDTTEIKDRNGMDLTEAEDVKKRWQEYTEELVQKRSS